jgi:predicted alpha/beta hydrolase family esterase
MQIEEPQSDTKVESLWTLHFCVIPGFQGSGEDHWQSLWYARLKQMKAHVSRLELDCWDAPDCSVWSAALVSHIMRQDRPVLCIAHSMGCLNVLAMLMRYPEIQTRIAGIYFVAPADPSSSAFPKSEGFGEPLNPILSLPCRIVFSTDDPYCSSQKSLEWAHLWGASIWNIGDQGHINPKSGHGDWEEGWRDLCTFARELSSQD